MRRSAEVALPCAAATFELWDPESWACATAFFSQRVQRPFGGVVLCGTRNRAEWQVTRLRRSVMIDSAMETGLLSFARPPQHNSPVSYSMEFSTSALAAVGRRGCRKERQQCAGMRPLTRPRYGIPPQPPARRAWGLHGRGAVTLTESPKNPSGLPATRLDSLYPSSPAGG